MSRSDTKADAGSFYSTIFNGGNGLDTDVVIKAGGKEWKAHSILLKANSNFFRACLESDCVESRTKTITLAEDEDTCSAFLEYLYSRKFQIIRETNKSDIEDRGPPPTSFDSKLVVACCIMADKYGTGHLIHKICDLLDRSAPSFGPVGSGVREIEIALEVLVNTKDCALEEMASLRDVLVKRICTLFGFGFNFNAKARQILGEYPDFAAKILLQLPQSLDFHKKIKFHKIPATEDDSGCVNLQLDGSTDWY